MPLSGVRAAGAVARGRDSGDRPAAGPFQRWTRRGPAVRRSPGALSRCCAGGTWLGSAGPWRPSAGRSSASRLRGLRVPSRATVVRRIAGLDPASSVAAREGDEAARRLRPPGGMPPAVTGLLEQVRVDHTPVM
ncbi:DNA-binding domain-containing protein [Streptomyces sp. NPDC001852]|uniref:DNA-binding domain-containing protein n=1 Tax=Streptomyces sp. NPDC001852 TaxID=3364619 RepID=UPI0036B4D632